MIDFAKLTDPEWISKARAAEALEQQKIAEQLAHQQQLIAECYSAYEQLPQRERKFVANCRHTLAMGLNLSLPQETWARDIVARLHSGQ